MSRMSLRISAKFLGRKRKGHYLLVDLRGDVIRSHAWANSIYNQIPSDIPINSRIQFYADAYPRPGGVKLSLIREVRLVEEGSL